MKNYFILAFVQHSTIMWSLFSLFISITPSKNLGQTCISGVLQWLLSLSNFLFDQHLHLNNTKFSRQTIGTIKASISENVCLGQMARLLMATFSPLLCNLMYNLTLKPCLIVGVLLMCRTGVGRGLE